MKVSKFRIAVLVLLLPTVVYVVAFAYSESTKPSKISRLYNGDIFVKAVEVSPTDNEAVWTDASGKTWKQPYRGELENPNVYVKTAVEYIWYSVKVPQEDDFQFETGVYHYNDRYYAIIKDILTWSMSAQVNPFWERSLEQREAFIFAGVLLAFGWAGVGTYSLNGGRRVKVLNAVTLTVAILIGAFLVEGIYRLHKEYEIVSAPLDFRTRMNPDLYHRIMERRQEIQAMIYQKIIGLAVVVIATTTALWFLNKRKVFKEKYAAVALILLLVGFFQVPTVHARTTPLGLYNYAGVTMEIPEDHFLKSVTGYITPRQADVSEGFTAYYIDVKSEHPDWMDYIQAGCTTDIQQGLGRVFYIEWQRINFTPAHKVIDYKINFTSEFSFFETYFVRISMEIVDGVILWNAFIYDSEGNVIMKMEDCFLRYSLTYGCKATGESLYDDSQMEAEFSELEWKCVGGYEGYWDGTEGFTCTVTEDDPYVVKMNVPYYDFIITGCPGPKTLNILPCEGGTTNPTPGKHVYDYGQSVTVWAEPDTWYSFHGWKLDGATVYGNPIEITMDYSYTLEAYFEESGGPGGPIQPPRPRGNESIPIEP